MIIFCFINFGSTIGIESEPKRLLRPDWLADPEIKLNPVKKDNFEVYDPIGC
jgi:hypothetical protein